MKNFLRRLALKWNEFWFSPLDLTPVIWTRSLFGITLAILYLYRFQNLDLLTDQAFVPREKAFELMLEPMRPLWSWTFWSDSWAFPVHLFFCAGLFMWSLGFGGRVLGALLWIIHMGFLQRNAAILFGADLIGGVFLFYLALIETPPEMKNGRWFLSWFRRKTPLGTPGPLKRGDLFSTVFYRLLQIQLCVIYAYTGFEKLRGASWWDGTALWSVVANSQMSIIDLSWVRSIPWVIPLLSFATVIFEIYFPVAMLLNWSRKVWLSVGVFFHTGIGILLALSSFSFVMMSVYFLFIPPSSLRCWEQKIRLFLRRPSTDLLRTSTDSFSN